MVTPTQLRAFAGVARLGSVKAAAAELDVTEAAVSMHVRSLRNELDDPLFSRSGSGISFTPGGLRLATRAVELLGLQEQTRREVRSAAGGKRVLRVAASSLFTEFAAAGLIELFSKRADDLEVELSEVAASRLSSLLETMGADIAIGPDTIHVPANITRTPFLRYEMITVCGPKHRFAGRAPRPPELAAERWMLGPSVVDDDAVAPRIVENVGVPEKNMRIYQSHAAAMEEVRMGAGLGLALGFRVADEIAKGQLHRINGPGLAGYGTWEAYSLSGDRIGSAARELRNFMTTPRASKAMIAGSGVGISHFRPSVHITLWS